MQHPPGEDAAIEALRGFAALIVVASHYAYLVVKTPGPWGFATTGVDLFFVLSGFVFAPYLAERRLEWLPHLARRFFRLYPLYLVALLAYVALKLPSPDAGKHFVEHLFMAHTLRSLDIAFYYNAAFWSLPPEVEFYLLLPLVAGVLRGRGFGLFVAFALAMHMALVALAVPGEGVTPRAIATVHLPGVLIEFCLGAWAARIAQSRGARGSRLARGMSGLAVLVAMAVLFTLYVADPKEAATTTPWLTGNVGLGAAFGYALVVSALAGGAQPKGIALSLCLLAGQLSYGIYLFHNAMPQVLSRTSLDIGGWGAVFVCLAATLVVAWLLHHAVEAPARNYGRALSARWRGQPAATNVSP
ncbi:acyltransferase family protein [Ramlibacter sp.]|uniref:acyltransferase family protein n=1 Tax=Ramlibacter sp. TaxID=1917967 RepID=UPI003D10CB23